MEAELQELLEQAARAYMDANYDEAVTLWQQALESDPDNTRAREGLKKVDMLRAGETVEDGTPSSPVLDEIEFLLQNRRFDEAVQVCRREGENASPSIASELRRLQQRAERARAAEPEIQRALHAARTALKEGRVKEALPPLKQVLALDQDHPVATRLMQAIRDRVRSRMPAAQATAPTPTAPTPTPTPPPELPHEDVALLPASGQPGSDAPDIPLGLPEEPPAAPGMGLPSSPPAAEFAADTEHSEDDVLEELELETLELESEDTALESPATDAEQEPDPLEPLAQAESPFALDDEDGLGSTLGSAGGRQRSSSAPSGAADDDILPSLSELPGVASPELDNDIPETPAGRSHGGGHSLRNLMLMAAAVTVVGLGAAWWFGVVEIPGLPTAPEPRPLVVPRPAARPEPANRPGTPETDSETPATTGTEAEAPVAGGQSSSRDKDPAAALKLFEDGQDHMEAGRIDEAVKALEEALRLDPMNGEISSLLQKALTRQENVQGNAQERRAAVKSFEGKDFDDALRRFYRLRESEADGPWDTYIVNSWFNWGLQLLANGNLREAEKKLDEALTINPDDEEALEIKTLISTYRSRPKDRVFFLRVEALRYRPLEG